MNGDLGSTLNVLIGAFVLIGLVGSFFWRVLSGLKKMLDKQDETNKTLTDLNGSVLNHGERLIVVETLTSAHAALHSAYESYNKGIEDGRKIGALHNEQP